MVCSGRNKALARIGAFLALFICPFFGDRTSIAQTAQLFVEPLYEAYTLSRYHPRSRSSASPLLSRLVHALVGSNHRSTSLASVRAIVGGSGAIDLEDLEAEASDALEAFAERLKESGARGWLLGTRCVFSSPLVRSILALKTLHSSPLPVDAALFAHLYALLDFPSLKTASSGTTNRLRQAVERHDVLVQWTKRLERQYIDA